MKKYDSINIFQSKQKLKIKKSDPLHCGSMSLRETEENYLLNSHRLLFDPTFFNEIGSYGCKVLSPFLDTPCIILVSFIRKLTLYYLPKLCISF